MPYGTRFSCVFLPEIGRSFSPANAEGLPDAGGGTSKRGTGSRPLRPALRHCLWCAKLNFLSSLHRGVICPGGENFLPPKAHKETRRTATRQPAVSAFIFS